MINGYMDTNSALSTNSITLKFCPSCSNQKGRGGDSPAPPSEGYSGVTTWRGGGWQRCLWPCGAGAQLCEARAWSCRESLNCALLYTVHPPPPKHHRPTPCKRPQTPPPLQGNGLYHAKIVGGPLQHRKHPLPCYTVWVLCKEKKAKLEPVVQSCNTCPALPPTLASNTVRIPVEA